MLSSKVTSFAVPPLFFAVRLKTMRSFAWAVFVVASMLPWVMLVADLATSIFAGGVVQPTGTTTTMLVKLFFILQSVVVETSVGFICTV
jgi:hypothetical protein